MCKSPWIATLLWWRVVYPCDTENGVVRGESPWYSGLGERARQSDSEDSDRNREGGPGLEGQIAGKCLVAGSWSMGPSRAWRNYIGSPSSEPTTWKGIRVRCIVSPVANNGRQLGALIPDRADVSCIILFVFTEANQVAGVWTEPKCDHSAIPNIIKCEMVCRNPNFKGARNSSANDENLASGIKYKKKKEKGFLSIFF